MDETEGSLIPYIECVNEVNQNVGAKYFSAYIHLLPTFFYYIRGDELQQLFGAKFYSSYIHFLPTYIHFIYIIFLFIY